jgi:hypothetical protein
MDLKFGLKDGRCRKEEVNDTRLFLGIISEKGGLAIGE